MSKLILASASPRRKELLEQAGIVCDVHPANVNEDVDSWDDIDAAVVEIAERKAAAISEKFPDRFVLAADTIVVHGKEVLGKPRDDAHAKEMLRSLQDTEHQVASVVVLVNQSKNISENFIVKTDVTLTQMSDERIDWYIATGEVSDKAGAYAIQGIGGTFVKSINGSYSNVVGLPLVETIELLGKHGAI